MNGFHDALEILPHERPPYVRLLQALDLLVHLQARLYNLQRLDNAAGVGHMPARVEDVVLHMMMEMGTTQITCVLITVPLMLYTLTCAWSVSAEYTGHPLTRLTRRIQGKVLSNRRSRGPLPSSASSATVRWLQGGCVQGVCSAEWRARL